MSDSGSALSGEEAGSQIKVRGGKMVGGSRSGVPRAEDRGTVLEWGTGQRESVGPRRRSGRQTGGNHLHIEFGRDESGPKRLGLAMAGLGLEI